jgi:RNA recognition motif-containing protein
MVDHAQIATDREPGRSRGFGFVDMPDRAASLAAIDGLHGTAFAGRRLTVDAARPRG